MEKKKVYREITREAYQQYHMMNKEGQELSLFPNGLPLNWQSENKYFGHDFTIENGKYYAVFLVGSSE